MSSKIRKINISFSKIFTVFGVGLAVLLPTRLYQLFCLTETDKSGFFTEINASVYILYIAAAVFSVLLFTLVALSNKVTASKSPRGKNKLLAVTSALFAAGLAYDVAISVSTFLKAVINYSAGNNALMYLFSNGMFAVLLEAVCGLAACIYFVLYSLSYFDGKTAYYEYKLLAIMPLFWAMFKMVYRFMTKISFTVVADLLIELFMLAFEMLFFMSFARISSQICQKYEMRKAMKYALPAAMLALLLGVSRLVATVFGKSECLMSGFGFSLADLTFGVFAVSYVYACSKTGRDESEDEDIPDENEKKQKEEETDEDFLNE